MCSGMFSQVQKRTKPNNITTGTIDEVLGDQDMEERGDAPEEAAREADLLEQMPLPTQNPRKNV